LEVREQQEAGVPGREVEELARIQRGASASERRVWGFEASDGFWLEASDGFGSERRVWKQATGFEASDGF
jgi:hypothetical protein